jgi:light-regulated signal transduction histidine kinase (bacteriophytochrome)
VNRMEINSEQVDLTRIGREIAEELQSSLPNRDVEFVIGDNLTAETDPRLIRIVLTNLLNNALKFTGNRQHAKIEFGSVGINGKTEFFVSDNGAGFDPNYTSKLFGAFQRLHSEKEFPGTGIGLATVQRIVHRQGGRIWADGILDQGAIFHFIL